MVDTVPSFDVNQVKPSALTLSLQDYEGYENKLYSLPNDGSGPTLGNGVDFGAQTADKFRRLKIPESTIAKAEGAGLFGLKGPAARAKVKELEASGKHITMFSAGEIAHMSNMVTLDGAASVIKDIGMADWNTRTTNEQTMFLSFVHQYGDTNGKNTNGYKQLKNRRYNELRANMQNWGDQTKDRDPNTGQMVVGKTAAAINKRYHRMSALVPQLKQP